ncbi:MAG TPA: SRPBCC family protein [Candidatus Saccharimonadia bacterium]|nr:SRPBCC family protein [Candidatus Saccharimonadia bacterium]
MPQDITSESSISINAPQAAIWEMLTDPKLVKQWFFGTDLSTTWEKGSPIVFRGEWQGKPYEDKGEITAIEPGKMFAYTHFSSRTGLADVPENYEQVAFYVNSGTEGTVVTVKESNLKSIEHRDNSLKIWQMILGNLKQTAEQHV